MAEKVRKLTVRNTAEQNRKVLERAMSSTTNLKDLRESCQKNFGLDILDEKKFPVADPGFSLGAMKRKLMTRENATGSGFPQLLRAGVQVAFNALVKAYTGTTYEKWVQVVTSDKQTELYAPLHGISFLAERGPQDKFAESQIAGLDLSLNNREFGQILSIDQNLLDDDQTGQMAQLVGDLAEWTQLLYEVYCYAKKASIAGQNYAGLVIPQSETKPAYEANYPYAQSSAPFRGGGFNRPASFGTLSQANIQAGIVALMGQKNLLGLKMVVNPSLLTVSPFHQFNAMVLMQSTLNPSGAAAAGNVGGAFSKNPIESILEVNVSRFQFDVTGTPTATTTAWDISDAKKPWFVLQLRDPGSVIMENPESGESFDRKVTRHRLDIRANADFIDPRFIWLGSDGSA